MAEGQVAGGVPPPLVFMGGLAAGVVVNFFLGLWILGDPWNYVAGGVLLITAVWLALDASRALSRHKTPPEPWKPSSHLVQDGPYRFSRNPIYLSFAAIYVGLALVFNSLPSIILLAPLLIGFDRTQILREERYLEGRFGDEYRQYKQKVRRWI